MSVHQDGPTCAGCEAKLLEATPELGAWFRSDVKSLHADAHIAWSFRGEADQNSFVAAGKSDKPWPESPHNHIENGKPCSMALDLFFQLNGKGSWDRERFREIADKLPAGMFWGGNFKSLGDYDHFQYRPEKKS